MMALKTMAKSSSETIRYYKLQTMSQWLRMRRCSPLMFTKGQGTVLH